MRSILITVACLALGASLGATVVVPADLGELSREAHTIARGRVVDVVGQWTDDRRTIETLVTLETQAFLKGDLGETVQFLVPGGSLGRFRNIVVGAPHFDVGQQVIVFLGVKGPGVPFVLGLSQGVFRVRQEPGGLPVVTPSAMPGVGLVVRGSPVLAPQSLTEFELRVRGLVQGRRE